MTAVTVESLLRAVGGERNGNGILTASPGHSVRDRGMRVWPDPTDPQGFRVHLFNGDDWQSAKDHIARALGMQEWRPGDRPSRRPDPSVAKPQSDRSRNVDLARTIHDESVPAKGTLVERYLLGRGLPVADALRFHPGLKHPSGGIWPVMVALVTRGHDGKPLAIHRTYLARDGIGKAPVAPQKMMLGPCRGGAVRLGQPDDVLMVGEGIETCLAAMLASGHPAWAALSTSGLRGLDLPKDVRDVIVLADGDEPGERAAREAGLRWTREGRHVRIARSPRGMDFNDILIGKVDEGGENAA